MPDMLLVGLLLLVMAALAYGALHFGASRGVRISETWGCGTPSQRSSTEYSGHGFSEPIDVIFSTIYRTGSGTSGHSSTDKTASSREGTAEIRLMKVFEEYHSTCLWRGPPPRAAAVLSRLQNGCLDTYLLYSFCHGHCHHPLPRVVCMNLSFVLYLVVNTLLVLAISPLFVSLIKKVKAWTQGGTARPSSRPTSRWQNSQKKEVIYSPHASAIMRVTPIVNIAAVLVAALFVPLVFVPEPVGGIGNIILLLYLLALAKFFMALAGLDAGSSFGGMGSSREMSISAIIEPTTIIVFAALVFVFRTLNVFDMFVASAAARHAFDADADPDRDLPLHHPHRRDLPYTGRQPGDAPGTDHDPRRDDPQAVGAQPCPDGVSSAVKLTLLMALLINLVVPYGLATSVTAARHPCSSGPLHHQGLRSCRDHRALRILHGQDAVLPAPQPVCHGILLLHPDHHHRGVRMIDPAYIQGIVRILFVIVIITAAYIISTRNLLSVVSVYALQSLTLVCIALALWSLEGTTVLLAIAVLTFVTTFAYAFFTPAARQMWARWFVTSLTVSASSGWRL